MKRWVASIALAYAAAAQALPVDISAEYTLTSLGMLVGRVSESFHREGDRYTIRSVTRSEGALKLVLDDNVTFESRGRIASTGLQPLEFERKRAGDASRDVHATFDWSRGVLVSRFRGETREVPLPAATQDRISVMYQFMNFAKPTRQVEMHMSNGRRVASYTYRFVEEVRLSTPAGDFETLHYQRVTGDERDSRTDVWLAREKFNFPVRVVYDDPRGLKLDQTLVELKMR